MRMADLIYKKREGGHLNRDEIMFIIDSFTNGAIPDYQMSAMCMAIYFRGMDKEETVNLTHALISSGESVDLSDIKGIKVDKHSTGGVGDKVSLIIIPLVSYVGVPVAKMSGRGLGHTGGTIDKLESIQGFKTELSREEFISNVNKFKMAIAGQTANLVPADKKLYALRDVTSTVDSIPLIASSVMSKKLASGADSIVLDVKVGSGAFMKSLPEAQDLAKTMVEIGNGLGRNTTAVISNMEQPLGYEIGNANEVREAITVLGGEGAADLIQLSLTVASLMCVSGGVFNDYETAYQELQTILKSGQALTQFKLLVKNQGGDPGIIDNPDMLPQAKHHIEVKAQDEGYVNSIDAQSIGMAAMHLGAGRKRLNDTIDFSAGITMNKKIGDRIEPGDILCTLHTNLEDHAEAKSMAGSAFYISESKPEKPEVIREIIISL